MPRPAQARQLTQLIARRDKTRGLLIAFEGPDGSGKTTQLKLLKRWLESRDQRVVSTRWASSPLMKPLLKVRKKGRTLSTEERSLLHAADVRHHVESSILPALWSGKTVLADRYLFTALARDAASGLDLDWLLHAYAPLLWPDVVLYFALSPDDFHRRLASTREDPLARYNNLSAVFRFATVDAGDAVYRQHTRVRQCVEQAEKRPWARYSKDAVSEWLVSHIQDA